MAERRDENHGEPETTDKADSEGLKQDWPDVSKRQHVPLFLSEAEEEEIANNIKEGIRLSVPNFKDDEDSVFSRGDSVKQPTREPDEWAKGLLKFATSEILKDNKQNSKIPKGEKHFPKAPCGVQNTPNVNLETNQVPTFAGDCFKWGNVHVFEAPIRPRRFQKTYRNFKSDFKTSGRPLCKTEKAAAAHTNTSDTSFPRTSGSNFYPVFETSPNNNKDAPFNRPKSVPAINLSQGDKTGVAITVEGIVSVTNELVRIFFRTNSGLATPLT